MGVRVLGSLRLLYYFLGLVGSCESYVRARISRDFSLGRLFQNDRRPRRSDAVAVVRYLLPNSGQRCGRVRYRIGLVSDSCCSAIRQDAVCTTNNCWQ